MKQEVTTKNNWNPSLVMEELENTKKMCMALLTTPHYSRMGQEGIFSITQKAKAMKLNPLDALNGGMYYVNGKVEMSANMMMQLIRKEGHSVTKDKRSDDTICILHGKRKDNGDTWTESFSIEDAQRAGIYRNMWTKYPRNMLFARSLSNLARQLFPDVIGGCYVEGEIPTEDPNEGSYSQGYSVYQTQEVAISPSQIEASPKTLTQEQLDILNSKLEENLSVKESLMTWLKNHKNTENIDEIPVEIYSKIMNRIEKIEKELITKEGEENE